MNKDWMDKAAQHAEKIFNKHGVKLTLGGEPTYVPLEPSGAEWSYAAVGPTKLDYAWRVANDLVARRMPGAVTFFCPGKSYPGEVNPRWALRIIANRDGSPVFQYSEEASAKHPSSLSGFRSGFCRVLGVGNYWVKFAETDKSRGEAWALPLDHDGEKWISGEWPIPERDRVLSAAEGPAGLRLPLHTIPEPLAKRVLSIERKGTHIAIFVPPLLQPAFLELLASIEKAASRTRPGQIEFQGYIPSDDEGRWTIVGVAADPGVLEINMPPCARWREYADWTRDITASCEAAGLRSWKEPFGEHPGGSGGGNHLLWGGPSIDEHPFFSRPRWLASVLRYWQAHPALAYLFTGSYVGASSQAPRPDESARDLYDLDMAYAFLEGLGEGDHRGLINETLRHLQTDVTGNAHRSEVSFDKFWNPGWPGGMLGLIEFRAIESLPTAEWMSAVALLWTCLAARQLETKPPASLKRFGTRLQDEFFLPSVLWADLETVLDDLIASGFKIDKRLFHEIWDWKFPVLASWKRGAASMIVRKAHESWPLLCETPVDGGTTSRFVDTSMQRIEFLVTPEFASQYTIRVNNRPLPIQETSDGKFRAGLRYRRTNLYPSLHPGIPPQLPLILTLIDKTGKVATEFRMFANMPSFEQAKKPAELQPPGKPCRVSRKGDLTCDLRLP